MQTLLRDPPRPKSSPNPNCINNLPLSYSSSRNNTPTTRLLSSVNRQPQAAVSRQPKKPKLLPKKGRSSPQPPPGVKLFSARRQSLRVRRSLTSTNSNSKSMSNLPQRTDKFRGTVVAVVLHFHLSLWLRYVHSLQD